ncbi:MAG TPA: ABC transporter ATP-binding protein [Thermomicrobiales bacterium]|nr:ABC transporter ATP-binding protein [Thermomicrobiales bacterium]
MATITLNNVVKVYGDVVAVDNVSLKVEDGEFVALVGPSGCGKTTTLNLVAGLIEITDGQIMLGDRQINDLDPRDRDLAMVFQNYALYPNKTVAENLAFPLRMRKMNKTDIKTQVERTAGLLSIDHLLARKPKELSGGQQQRVALGRALVRNPKAFLMDEPLSNLDAKLRVQMRSELKRFHVDLKATILYVTHDQLEAVTMADRIAVMSGGLLQQYGSPDEIFNRPVNTFVAGFVGSPSMNLLKADVQQRGTETWLTNSDGWSFQLSPERAEQTRHSSGAVTLGIRHGHIAVSRTEVPDAMLAKVYTIEPTGDITFVYLNLGNAVLVASAPADFRMTPDAPIWIRFDQEQLHLFDAVSEQALPGPGTRRVDPAGGAA